MRRVGVSARQRLAKKKPHETVSKMGSFLKGKIAAHQIARTSVSRWK